MAVVAALTWLGGNEHAFAQAHNPFSVGISEGGGSATGLSGWLLAEQGKFELMLSGAVKAAKSDGSAIWFLSGLGFIYGVLHAAGPGHGKAVVASYMFANERALRRGVALSFLAAALQAVVAIALVGVLALVFHATARSMRDAAQVVESLSYAGIAMLGLVLLWRKGRTLPSVWRAWVGSRGNENTLASWMEGATTVRGYGPDSAVGSSRRSIGPRSPMTCLAGSGHVHGPTCGHVHALDPADLGDGFSWSNAALTVAAAGLRPCSGAILVLVFALAQGIFAAGIYATLAMSLGTAVTTSALATLAVLAGGMAVRLSGKGTARGALIARVIETSVGAFIFLLGLGLFFGVTAAISG